MTQKVEMVLTGDGSYTLYNYDQGEHYHSTFGAVQESQHIFLGAGFIPIMNQTVIHMLEVGFGTGLNAMLTWQKAYEAGVKVNYEALEPFPLTAAQGELTGYHRQLGIEEEVASLFHWAGEEPVGLPGDFILQVRRTTLEQWEGRGGLTDLVYFDAFSPEVQPHLWTEEGFQKLYHALRPGGVLVTYSCKGTVKRALKAAGFMLEKLPGPPGKREFLRATRPIGS